MVSSNRSCSQNWVELLPHICGLVLCLGSCCGRDSTADLQTLLIFAVLGMATSALHARSAALISGVLSFVHLLMAFQLWLGEEVYSLGDNAFGVAVSLLGIYVYQNPISQPWDIAMLTLDLEIVFITTYTPLALSACALVVVALALFCRCSGVVLCLHEAFLLFAVIVISLQHMIRNNFTQVSDMQVCVESDLLMLVLTITTIGVVVTLGIGMNIIDFMILSPLYCHLTLMICHRCSFWIHNPSI
jgi:hypothetical protein